MAELTRRLAAADEETARIKKEANSRKASRPASREEAVAPPSPQKTKRSVLGKLDIDEASDKSIGQQLKEALRANSGRVIDLFREWDTDGDGEISRKEFHTAIPRLGFDATKAEIDALFDSWDPDGGGSLDFKELQKVLRGDAGGQPPAAKVSAGFDKVAKMSSAATAMKAMKK